jgi:hypothetical protein
MTVNRRAPFAGSDQRNRFRRSVLWTGTSVGERFTRRSPESMGGEAKHQPLVRLQDLKSEVRKKGVRTSPERIYNGHVLDEPPNRILAGGGLSFVPCSTGDRPRSCGNYHRRGGIKGFICSILRMNAIYPEKFRSHRIFFAFSRTKRLRAGRA